MKTVREGHGGVKLLYAVTVPISVDWMRGQLAEMTRRGYDVTLLCSPGEKLLEVQAREGVRIHPLPIARQIHPLRDIVSLFRLVRYLRTSKPDIVNVGTPKAGLVMGLAAWIARVPVRIYTLHGLRLETLSGWKRRLLVVTEKLACAASNRVWCVSNSLKECVLRLRITHARKIVVLGKGSNNGLDMNRFPIHSEAWSLGETELRSSLGLSKETPVVGFVGRLTIDKGIRELLEAFDRLKQMLPSVKLLIVGTFEEEDPVPQDLRSRIESDPSIVFVPYQQEPAPYYALMNVFLFPTYREGFGNVILEAGAAGIPVVATDVTGVKDAVVHEVTGFIVPVRDGQALADAAAVLLQDRKLAERLGRNGRERVEREYRSEIIWDALDQFYLEMLAARG